MTALQELRNMPESFLELVNAACPAALTPAFHEPGYEGRFVDVMEMYSGSARLSSFCSKVACLLF